MEIILRAEHLAKTFRRGNQRNTEAVEDASFSLERGEILGLVGESGCGKSTTARMLAGLIRPDYGRILIGDEDMTAARGKRGMRIRQQYGRIQMIFQNPVNSFDPRRTLGYGIRESLLNRGMGRAEADGKVRNLLERCGLSADYAARYPHEVSGGECQRAAIARALAPEPEILISDEATSSLDAIAQREITGLLEQLRREQGISILFISHNLPLVQELCDRVMVMHQGRITGQLEKSG